MMNWSTTQDQYCIVDVSDSKNPNRTTRSQ